MMPEQVSTPGAFSWMALPRQLSTGLQLLSELRLVSLRVVELRRDSLPKDIIQSSGIVEANRHQSVASVGPIGTKDPVHVSQELNLERKDQLGVNSQVKLVIREEIGNHKSMDGLLGCHGYEIDVTTQRKGGRLGDPVRATEERTLHSIKAHLNP